MPGRRRRSGARIAERARAETKESREFPVDATVDQAITPTFRCVSPNGGDLGTHPSLSSSGRELYDEGGRAAIASRREAE